MNDLANGMNLNLNNDSLHPLDVYGKDITGTTTEENAALMQPFMDDRGLLRDRLLAGYETLKAHPQTDADRIAVIGYCFGGLCALDLARSGTSLCGAVSFHGLLMPSGLPSETVKARVLALHGWDDPMAAPAAVNSLAEEMSAMGADWQLHAYGNTMHAFTNPAANDPARGTVYDATADRRSWRAMTNFFEELFGG